MNDDAAQARLLLVVNALPMVADGSDVGFADQILELFVQGTKTALDAIEQAVRVRNLASLARVVHTLKSSAAVSVLSFHRVAAHSHRTRPT